MSEVEKLAASIRKTTSGCLIVLAVVVVVVGAIVIYAGFLQGQNILQGR